jgi:hypothetical protein
MATPATETSWGLLAVDPDMTEPLSAVALCEAGLGFVSTVITVLYMSVRIKIRSDFWERARVTRNRGRDIVIKPSGKGRLVVIYFTLVT